MRVKSRDLQELKTPPDPATFRVPYTCCLPDLHVPILASILYFGVIRAIISSMSSTLCYPDCFLLRCLIISLRIGDLCADWSMAHIRWSLAHCLCRGGSRGAGGSQDPPPLPFWGSGPPSPPFWGTPKFRKEGKKTLRFCV